MEYADREESAPLLHHNHPEERDDRNFFSALTHPTRPLTNLEKVLAGAAVALLLLTGTFVGLFAGAESALNKERGKGGGRTEWKTETRTLSGTVTATTTAPGTTVTAVPTGKPKAVSYALTKLLSDITLISAGCLRNTRMRSACCFYHRILEYHRRSLRRLLPICK